MNRFLLLLVALSIAVQSSCASQHKVSAPQPYGAIPTANQLAWHEMEYFGLVCYGLNTYTGQEWGYGDVSTDVFQPTDLNTDQWARVAKQAGMTGLILVAKHHDGFCLWPSKTTDYTIAAASWKDGKGDVLGDLSKSCKKYGLKLGVYVSPWDRNHAEYGNEKYIEDYFEQWREVLTNYGPVFEVWFDGANGGTGYYGGARERRSIPKDYYRYPEVFRMIKELQPETIFFGGINTDAARWVGNESGYANETNWCTFSDTQTSDRKLRESGVKGGKYWLPAEADTTILYPKKWYYNKSSKPRTLKQFTDLYYTTIGRNAVFNLGLSIAPSGRIHDDDAKAMLAQKEQIDKELADNLAAGAAITATNFRGNDKTFGPEKTIDGSTKTYWATSDGTKTASLTINFKKPTTFNRLLVQEYIALGQRVDSFTLEAYRNGTWVDAAKGTTIGYKRILRFPSVTAGKARLTLSTDAPCLTLSNLAMYNAQVIMTDPIIKSNRDGKISIQAPADTAIFYIIGDKSAETEFTKYTAPFDLASGGTVRAYALDPSTDSKSDLVSSRFGVAKADWKIIDCTFPNKDNASVNRLIDGDLNTMWHTHGTEGRQSPPQSVTIDLGKTVNIAAFTYMPRHDACFVGLVDRYEFYTSIDGENWDEPAVKGEFHNIKNNPIQQTIKLPSSIKARFIRFTATHALEANDCVAICELGIIAADN